MYRKCCVVDCESTRKDVGFYKIPKSETGLLWLKCNKLEHLQGLSSQQLAMSFVCAKHFEKKYFTESSKRSRLHQNAIPTLFTESEIKTRIPGKTGIVKVALDHDYTRKRKHCDHTYSKLKTKEKLLQPQSDFVPLPSTSMHIPQSIEDLLRTDVLPSSFGSGIRNEVTDNTPKARDVLPSSSDSGIRKKVTGNTPIARDVSTPKRKRVIHNMKSLTPSCTKLYSQYVKARRQLNFNRRAKQAMKFSKENAFEKMTQNMNPLAKKLMWMQIKQCTKSSRGRRFTHEEKLIALSIMKQSPKCYKFLHRIFILPSKHTLNKMISGLSIGAGINPQVFEAVKKEVATWEINKKYCSVLFDEVALDAGVNYDRHKDIINGFVHFESRTNEYADHALVFMLRGAVYKWQQPVTFYFCKGATSGWQLKKIIKDMIIAISDVGLLPIALICDQGSAFQSTLKSLQEDTRREQTCSGKRTDDVIEINGHSLNVIYDPPHLIKGIRNNFLTKYIKHKNQISKWSDIVDVYTTDCNHTKSRLLHRLNDEHVIPEKIKKMKVKNCVRVFSKTVSATLSYTAQFSHYADGNEVSPTLNNTAKIVSFLDDLFDSVNGASLYNAKCKGKPLRRAVTEASPHHTFWKDAIKTLKELKFVDKSGKETTVPSLKNWVTTLESHQRLWNFFKSKNIKIMRPRYFNSDPIENFFGQVRAYNFRNNDPNCHTFTSTFRSLLITRFIKFHSETYNCEEDSGDQLLKLQSLFERTQEDAESSSIEDTTSSCIVSNSRDDSCNSPESSHLQSERILLSARQERLHVHSRAYTTGWVIRKTLNKIKCTQCENDLISNETSVDTNSVNNWISFKEFKSIKTKKLTYPSEQAVRFFGIITEEANMYLESKPQHDNIIKNIKSNITSNYVFDFLTCETHKHLIIEYFMEFSLLLAIYNWCNVINKILKGTDVFRLRNKSLPPMQLKAYNKYRSKLKNKNFNKYICLSFVNYNIKSIQNQ